MQSSWYNLLHTLSRQCIQIKECHAASIQTPQISLILQGLTGNEIKVTNPVPLDRGSVEPHSNWNNKRCVGSVREEHKCTPPSIKSSVRVDHWQPFSPKQYFPALNLVKDLAFGHRLASQPLTSRLLCTYSSEPLPNVRTLTDSELSSDSFAAF